MFSHLPPSSLRLTMRGLYGQMSPYFNDVSKPGILENLHDSWLAGLRTLLPMLIVVPLESALTKY